jgi:hypothetical protein
MGCRHIEGLIWARKCERPRVLPVRRPRGATGAGLRYERLVGERLRKKFPGEALLGQWFQFEDAHGRGYCQADIVVPQAGRVVVLECKLTDTDDGREQLSWLYLPIVAHIWKRPAVGIVVAKYLTDQSVLSALVLSSLSEAMSKANGVIPTLHWIGKGRLS